MRSSITVAPLLVMLALTAAVVAQEVDVYSLVSASADLAAPPPEASPFKEEPVDDEAYAATDECCGVASGCDVVGCCPCPSWCFQAAGLLIDRSRPDDAVLVTDSAQPGGNVMLDANDYDFDFRGGFEVSAIRRNLRCSCWDLEARYFRVDGWEATQPTAIAPSGLWSQYARPIGSSGPVAYTSGYCSDLDGFELNLRRPVGCGWLTVLGGFRFVELDERGWAVAAELGPNGVVATHRVGAINDLYGFQLGADACLIERGCFHVDTLFRAGVYGNHAVNDVLIRAGGATLATRAKDNCTSFLGELGLTGTCQLIDCMALTAGYRITWLDEVAVASDQMAVSDPWAGTATVDTSGSPFYHGFVISLEYCR
ncbi:MAG: BBP7 family outer membrane beta-barrel protein [Planctomycetes bacterium]|nr:BBP7 family outer membrane beta-barrel protein [Planctomycetota bacterium]